MDRAAVLRGAVANSVLEGWAPTPLDLERLSALAAGAVPLAQYLDAATERALNSASEIGAPDCIEVPRGFPDTLYPGTRILRNVHGIRDAAVLQQLEFETATAQQFGIETSLIEIPATFDAAHLTAIHRALFGTIYPWAGVYRRYDMTLRHNVFHAAWIDRYLQDAVRVLHEHAPHTQPKRKEQRVYAHHAAHVYAYLNCAHPFRDGNGRTSKTLLQSAAARDGYRFDFDAITKRQWDSASRRSAPDHGHYRPDSHALYSVFGTITRPTTQSR